MKYQEEKQGTEVIDETTEKYYEFWFSEVKNKQGDLVWKIDHLKLAWFLQKSGFRRFDINKDYIFIHIKDRIISEVPITFIQDHTIKYIRTMDLGFLTKTGITREGLLLKFFTSPQFYFNDRKLTILGTEPNLTLNEDTKEKGFIYYENGFVQCTIDGFELLPYKQLKGHIFKNQVKNRKFTNFSEDGIFKKFVFNISGNEQRFLALRTIIGYLLHGYFETKMKAVNLTDSEISDVAEGRTGKTLLGRAISHIKNVCEISGKDFEPTNKHKYAAASLDTQIVFLNDLRKNFKFEALFNDISDAITVDRKNLQPFQIRAKMLIASNDTFRIEGASAKDRVIEFELTNHYSADHTPVDEFKVWFFKEWDENEWLAFDNFMMNCICQYLRNGIIEVDPINLEKRKKIQHTNPDFVEWFDDLVENGEIKKGGEYNKTVLHQLFLKDYPEYTTDRWLHRTSNFTKYLKTCIQNTPELKGKITERKSNRESLIRIDKSNDDQEKLQF